jgi:hypothetical protein
MLIDNTRNRMQNAKIKKKGEKRYLGGEHKLVRLYPQVAASVV